MIDYHSFLAGRCQDSMMHGFAPTWLPDALFPFQRSLVEWAIRKGRAAIFADCGLGKSLMQFVFARNVARKSRKPFLYVTTLGDSLQTIDEAAKFGIEAVRSKDGCIPLGAEIVVTNYERLHLFSPDRFGGVACNESSCIKDFDGKRSGEVREFLRTVPYRLLCTATAAPNDHTELGTSAEALGEIGHLDMLARYFRSDDGSLHPFRNYPRGAPKPHGVWDFRPHAEQDFWRWACSWARACRKPSDLGFSDDGFVLPDHVVTLHNVASSRLKPGYLFPMPAKGLYEQREEQSRTIEERCGKVADLVAGSGSAVAWCHTNAEGDLLSRIIPGAVQVSGKDHDDDKEVKFKAFVDGQIRVLVTKPKIAGFGLNWQHCHHQTYFPSHSFEQYYQAIRRLLRFGQEHPVRTDLVTTEGGIEVIENLRRKERKAERQYDQLVTLMNSPLRVGRAAYGTAPMEAPAWL